MSVAELLQEISTRYNLGAVYAFGSRAIEVAGRVRGEAVSSQLPESDVDIGIQPRSGDLVPYARERSHLPEGYGQARCRSDGSWG